MRGSICLIKVNNERIVPAMCIDDSGDKFLFSQIRTAREDEIPSKDKRQLNKKPENRLFVKTLYIGQPKGVKTKSVVMVTKQYRISRSSVVKTICKGEQGLVDTCLKIMKNNQQRNALHEELKIVKKKLALAQMNNEPYGQYEKRMDQIIKELGYSKTKGKKNKKPYRNFREVPVEGHIKVYLGGR